MDTSFFSFMATLGIAVLFFGLFAAALAIPLARGKKMQRRCACAASLEVLRLLRERDRAALDAKRYRPETVDAKNLPIASPELAQWARGSAQSHNR
ncbi:MAG: hypothetical protein ACI4NV_00385 [Thermoguttaceae bacterium]